MYKNSLICYSNYIVIGINTELIAVIFKLISGFYQPNNDNVPEYIY